MTNKNYLGLAEQIVNICSKKALLSMIWKSTRKQGFSGSQAYCSVGPDLLFSVLGFIKKVDMKNLLKTQYRIQLLVVFYTINVNSIESAGTARDKLSHEIYDLDKVVI